MNFSSSQSFLAPTSAKFVAKDFPWPKKEEVKSVILISSLSYAGRVNLVNDKTDRKPIKQASVSFGKLSKRRDTFWHFPDF